MGGSNNLEVGLMNDQRSKKVSQVFESTQRSGYYSIDLVQNNVHILAETVFQYFWLPIWPGTLMNDPNLSCVMSFIRNKSTLTIL